MNKVVYVLMFGVLFFGVPISAEGMLDNKDPQGLRELALNQNTSAYNVVNSEDTFLYIQDYAHGDSLQYLVDNGICKENKHLDLLQTFRNNVSGVISVSDKPRIGTRPKVFGVSNSGSLLMWDVESGRPLNTWVMNQSEIESADFSPDGSKVVIAGGRMIKVVDIFTGVQSRCELDPFDHPVTSVGFSPDGSKIFAGLSHGGVIIFDVQTGERFRSLRFSDGFSLSQSQVDSACFSLDGSKIVAGSHNGLIVVWDVQTGERLQVFHNKTVYRYFGISFDRYLSVASVNFSPDGSKILSTTYGDNIIKVWNVATGECLQVLQNDSSYVSSAIFSPGGSKIFAGLFDGNVQIWSVETGKCLSTIQEHEGEVTSISFSADGLHMFSVGKDDKIKMSKITSDVNLKEAEKYLIDKLCALAIKAKHNGTTISYKLDDNQQRIFDSMPEIIQNMFRKTEDGRIILFSKQQLEGKLTDERNAKRVDALVRLDRARGFGMGSFDSTGRNKKTGQLKELD